MKFLMEGKSWPEPAQKDSIVEPSLPLKDVFAVEVPASSEEGLKMRSTMASVERDPLGKAAKEPGSKLDSGKVDVYRGAISYFPRALEAVAAVSEKGAAKYSWKGWETVPDGQTRYTAAMARHLIKEDREEFDADTGCAHIAQTAWNAMARLELYLREKETNIQIRL